MSDHNHETINLGQQCDSVFFVSFAAAEEAGQHLIVVEAESLCHLLLHKHVKKTLKSTKSCWQLLTTSSFPVLLLDLI